MKLSIDFSQDGDLEAIKTKVLSYLKDNIVDSKTLICLIRGQDGPSAPMGVRIHISSAESVETEAENVAYKLVQYARGKDGHAYSDATLETRRY